MMSEPQSAELVSLQSLFCVLWVEGNCCGHLIKLIEGGKDLCEIARGNMSPCLLMKLHLSTF